MNQIKNGTQLKDQVQTANQFNHYFASVANIITKNIPRNPKIQLSHLMNPDQDSQFIYPCTSPEASEIINSMKSGKASDSQFINPCTSPEVSEVITSMMIGKASDPNSIPIKLSKLLDPLNSVSLSSLINESSNTASSSDSLKKWLPGYKGVEIDLQFSVS